MNKRTPYIYIRRAALLIAGLCCSVAGLAQMPWNMEAEYPKHETRAVWVTTLFNLDWPQTKATGEAGRERQQQELCRLLDKLQQAGINTVMLQTRVRGSVIYPSAIEPWDVCLTGKYDDHPGYDPLAFAVKEAHRRGMELHAWVVSVPAFKMEVARKMGRKCLLSTHPGLLKKHEGMYYLDPSLPESATYLASICREIAANYDVDGIHLDYIRYPENAKKFPDALSYSRLGKGKSKDEWRRDNINRMVRAVHDAVREVKPLVKLSSSPVGKYRDTRRQSSKGWNCYDAVAQDAKRWLREGWQDMLFPMMYFTGEHFYPFVDDWKEGTGRRPVVPGLGIYFLSPSEKNWPLQTVSAQLNVVRQEGLGGQAFFRSRFLTDNVKGIYTLLQNTFYACPALPAAMPWLDNERPTPPASPIYNMEKGLCRVRWAACTDNHPEAGVTYNVYAGRTWPVDVADARNLVATGLRDTTYTFNPFQGLFIAVTAMDRCGNESAALQLSEKPDKVEALQGRFLPIDSDVLEMPAEHLLPHYRITDMAGRELQAGPWSKHINVARLRPGLYRLSAVGKRGTTTPVGWFRK